MVTTPSPIFKMKPADLVDHPTGGSVFGVIPPITAMNINLAEGKVYVKVGQHFHHARAIGCSASTTQW
ncbi:hypothetical protein [Pseudomonas sp. Teo4]|uniref:hypothetical protein n=1 Tax=Pseudomonas sp. Teo4 TaxID=3064528 RepID=UPI002ABA6087|nr:hypothetical protein [Pseudomonas sp. Teo4]MDZ3993864.1 hypothetical protein [Pseudomonas sp. Teo4]